MTSIYQQQIIDHYKYPRNFVKLDNPTIEYGDKKILIDCGLFQGRKELRSLNWKPLVIDPTNIAQIE